MSTRGVVWRNPRRRGISLGVSHKHFHATTSANTLELVVGRGHRLCTRTMSSPPRDPPLTLASALPIALVLHVKNRVAEDRRRARRRARLEARLLQAGKLRDRLVALVRAAESAAAEDHDARVTFLLRAATGAVAPRETEPEDDPFLFLRRARAFRLAEQLAAAGTKHPDPSPARRRAPLNASADAADAAVRAIDDVPAAFAALELLLETMGAGPHRAREEPTRAAAAAVAAAPRPLARGFPPSVGERYATLAVRAIAAARDAETTNISDVLRVTARDAADAIVDAFLRADRPESRTNARVALLAAADASFAVAAPLLASCARAVRRVVDEVVEKTKQDGKRNALTVIGTAAAPGEANVSVSVSDSDSDSFARLESDALAREGRLARVFWVADRVARRLVDEPSRGKGSNAARADAREASREMTRATAAAERGAEAERERAPLAARARRLRGTLRLVLEKMEGEG